jgi:putative oxidoreductase
MTSELKTQSIKGRRRGLPGRSQRTGLATSRVDRVSPSVGVRTIARVRALDDAAAKALRPVTLPALRMLLGLVFIWFGGLKVTAHSPVEALVGQTLPFADLHLVMIVLGSLEVALGILVITGLFVRCALWVLAAHLAGTFLTFVDAPHLMITGGDPLLLTADGEFVLKNLVLIAAAMVLITHSHRNARTIHYAPEIVPNLVDVPA